jgi:hypothetical protein
LAAYGALLRAADEIMGSGSFDFAADNAPYGAINGLMKG